MNRTQFLRAALLAGGSLAVITFAAPAFGQAQEAPQPQADAAPQRDVVVVTAQRREETVLDVPMAVQAFSGEDLEMLRVNDVKDLSAVAPSFTVSQSYQGVPIYTLRGIGFNTINLSSTSTVGTYVDEVAYAYPFMMTGPIFDLERVEVLKGPQGTLYGRNTTAGLIDFITNDPTDTFEASVTGEIGNYQTAQLSAAMSAVRSATTFRARLAFRSENSDEGWQESNTRDEPARAMCTAMRRALRMDWTADRPADFRASLSGWVNKSDTSPRRGSASRRRHAGIRRFRAVQHAWPGGLHRGQPADQVRIERGLGAANPRGADIGIGAGLAGDLTEDTTFWAAALRGDL